MQKTKAFLLSLFVFSTVSVLAITDSIHPRYLPGCRQILSEEEVYDILRNFDRCLYANLDSAFIYAQLAYDQSERWSFNKGMALSMEKTGDCFKRQGERDSTVHYYQNAHEIAMKDGPSRVSDLILFKIGNISRIYRENDEALRIFNLALESARQRQDSLCMGRFLQGIGNIYIAEGNYTQSLETYLEALKMSEGAQDHWATAIINMSIGNVVVDQGEIEEAIRYYQKALSFKPDYLRKQTEAICYINIGAAYDKLKLQDSSFVYYQEALKLSEELGDRYNVGMSYLNLGGVEFERDNYPAALDYLRTAEKIFVELEGTEGQTYTYNLLGSVYIAQGNYSQGIPYIQKALDIAEQTKALPRQKEALENLHQALAESNNYKAAYEAHVEYKTLFDSIYNEENDRKLVQLELGYEFDKEKEIMELERSNAETLFNRKIRYQTRMLWTGAFGLIILSFLFILMIRSLRLVRKRNRQVAEKNELLEKQKQEIENKNKQLVELSDFKDGMVNMVVHDMKNPLNYILSMASRDQKIDSTQVMSGGKQMMNLVQNMLDVYKIESQKFVFEKSGFLMIPLIESAIGQVEYLSQRKEVKIQLEAVQDTEVFADKDLIERVIINLLTNAIKFTEVNSLISIRLLTKESDRVCVKVEDQGEGISIEDYDRIFDKFSQVVARRSGDVRSTGLGLAFCKAVVEAHHGEIGVERSDENGSIFYFNIPLSEVKSLEGKHVFESSEKGIDRELDPEDLKEIEFLLKDLSDLAYYESSEILKILEQLNKTDSERIRQWKQAVENSVFECNEKAYLNLTKKLINEN